MFKKLMKVILIEVMIMGQIWPVGEGVSFADETNNDFLQTDWSGGGSEDNASHPGGQADWNKYLQKDPTVNTAITGRAYIAGQPANKTEDTESDFGQGTLVNTQVTGTGTAAKIEQVPSVSDPFTTDLKTWGNPALPPKAPYSGAAYVYVSSQNSVYAFWGQNQNIFWMYDLSAKKWVKKADAPNIVMAGACLAYTGTGDYIYAIRGGGFTDFWRYQISTDTWDNVKYNTTVITTPKPAFDGSSMVVTSSGQVLILFGSQGGAVGYSYELHRYTIASGTWTRETSIPSYVTAGSLLLYQGTGTVIYYLRGQDVYKTFYRYNWQTKVWNNAADGGNPVDMAYSEPWNNAYLNSGSAGFYRVSDNCFYVEWGNTYRLFYKYSLTDNTWTRLKDTTWETGPGSGLVYNTTNDKALIFYGTQLKPSTYNWTDSKWEEVSLSPWCMAYGSAGVYYNGEIYFSKGKWGCLDFFKYTIATNTWTGLAGIPYANSSSYWYWGGALTVNPNNGDMYATKGYNYSVFYKYTPGNNTWTQLTNAPVGFYGGADLAYYKDASNNEYVFALGGYNAKNFYRYNIASNDWTKMADTLDTVGYGGSLVYPPGGGDFIYAFRGCWTKPNTEGYYYANGYREFWRYSISGNTWTALTECPFRICEGARLRSDAAGTYLYAVVGSSTPLFVRYNISANTWAVLPQIKEALINEGGLVVDTANNQIYAWEGDGKSDLFKYDIAGNTWSDRTVQSINQESWQAGDSFWDGVQFVYPGGDTAYLFQGWRSGNIWPYTISTNTWSPPIKTPFGLGYGLRSLVVDSDTVYFVEGQGTPYFWKWAPSTNTWTQLADVNLGGLKDRVGWGSGLVYVPTAGDAGKIYCQVGNYSYLLRSYDIATDTWSGEINSPTYNDCGGFLLYSGSGSYLYSIVGRDTTTVYRYDMNAYAWTGMANGTLINMNNGMSYYYSGTGNYAYVLPRSDTLKFLRFDFSTEQWTDLCNYPFPGYDGRSAIFASGNMLYAFFAKNSAGSFRMHSLFDKYDISKDKWQAKRAFPTYFNYGHGVYVPKMRAIYVARGYDSRTFYRYLLDKDIWEQMTDVASSDGQPYEYPIFAYDETSDPDYIYCARTRGYTDFYRYKISANTWETLAPIPLGCLDSGICRPKGSQFIYLLRGSTTKTLYRYDTGSNTWSTAMPDAPWDVYDGAMIYPGTGDYIYVLRGRWTQDFKRFNYKTEQWDETVLALPPAALSPDQQGAVYPGFGDYIYVIRPNNYRDLWRYSVTANTWEILPDCPSEVHNGAIFYGGDGYLCIIRGYLYTGNLPSIISMDRIQIASFGSYTSKVMDTGKNQGWGNMDWVSSTASKVRLKARSSDYSSMSGAVSWPVSPWINKNTDLSSYMSTPDSTKYIQYYAELVTDDLSAPASLDKAVINYNYYLNKQEIISSAYDSGDSQNRLMKLTWDEIQPSGTDIRFQFRTYDGADGAPEEEDWGPWAGPGGTQTFNNNFTLTDDYAFAPEIEIVSSSAKLKKILQDFAYTQMITIDASDETRFYTNQTVTLEFTAVNKDFWSHVKSDGSDIRFVDSLGASLVYNISSNGASFDYVNKYAKIFVRVPTIPPGQKTKIYLKYGKEDAVSQSSSYIGSNNVFNNSKFTGFDAGAIGGKVCKGYTGAVFDGRYVYFAPYHNSSPNYSGIVLRYDTQGSYSDSGSWASFDAGNIDGLNTKGFIGAVFDGRYVYFVPYLNGGYHGNVLRYDTQANFTTIGSWQAYNADGTDGYSCVGYQYAVFDGKYIYFVPHYGSANYGSAYHGIVLRYDTTLGFKDKTAWSAFDATSTGGKSCKGFNGAVFDGRYVYFAPYHNSSPNYSGIVLRYDTQTDFANKSSWLAFDASDTNSKVCKGYTGAVFDGRYIYYAPYYNGGYHGIVLRYDTQAQGGFIDAGSWNAYDAGLTGGMITKGFYGAVFDGRYVYFVPYLNGNVLRYDTQSSFLSSSSWNAVDASSSSGLLCKGYIGAVSDGRYVYFAPCYNNAYHGNVLRMEAGSSLELPYYAYAISGDATSPSLSGWTKRLVVNIDNSKGGSLTNYQVKLTLGKEQAESFWASCKNDGADIRFIDSNNTTILKYWRQSFDYENKAGSLWVKVPSIAAGEIKTIYLYYGRQDAGDDSNYDNTMTKDFSYEKTANISGVSLNGLSDKVTVPNSSPLNMASAVTLEAQVKYDIDYWPSGWTYRKKITLDNTAGTAKTNTVVQFDVPYQAEMKADYADLRFWEIDHSRKLRYKIGSSDGSKATVLVEISVLPKGTKDIYIYYGNSGAISESDTDFVIVPSNGLSAWWKFDEGIGTTVLDSTGNTTSGQFLDAPTWVDGRISKALSFDGINDLVSVDNTSILNIGGPITIGMYIKTPTIREQGICSKYSNHGYWVYRIYMNSSGKITFQRGQYGSWQTAVTSNTVLSANTFYHIVAVYNSAQMKIYINGNLDNSVSESRDVTYYGGCPFFIGTNTYANSVITYGIANTFSGIIDELAIYNTALTNDEIYNMSSREGWSVPTAFSNQETEPATLKWLPGFGYRKIITFDNTAGNTRTNAVVQCPVSYISGKMNADYSDLRFVDTDGRKLSCRLVTSDASQAVFSIKIPYITAKAKKDIFMYYGNVTALSESDSSVRYMPSIGLSGFWDFEEGAGALVYDKSGNNNTGAVNGAVTWGTGKYGNALTFNGTSTFIDIPHTDSLSLGANNTVTIAAWVKPALIAGDYRCVIGKSGWTDNNFWSVNMHLADTTALHANFTNTQNQSIAYTGGSVTLNQWVHMAVTYDGTTTRVYKDGGFVGSGAGSLLPLRQNTYPVRIGAWYSNDTNYFNGVIDDVAIYSRTLSSNEIQTLMLGANGISLTTAFAAEEIQPADFEQLVIDKGDAYALMFDHNGLTAVVNDTGVSTVNYKTGVFSHIAMTYDGVNLKLFVDGREKAARAVSGAINTNANDIKIGENLKGAVDEIRIWNIARTQPAINTDKQKMINGNETGLAAWFTCNENTGAVLNNAPLNPNTTLTGAITGAEWLAKPFAYINEKAVVLYHCDTGSGNSAIDSSGNANTLALSNVSWDSGDLTGFTGAFALSFNGTTSYGQANDSPSLGVAGDISIEAWIKPQDTLASKTIIDKGNDVTNARNYALYLLGSQVVFSFYDGTAYKNHTTSQSGITALTPYYITAVFNDETDTVKIYVNGVEKYSNIAETSVLVKNALPLLIGKSVSGNYFYGAIDEIRVYNRVLPQDEIIAHYKKQSFSESVPAGGFSYEPAVVPGVGVYSSANPVVQPIVGVFYNDKNIADFTEVSNKPAGTDIKYQLSKDGYKWYWFNGTAWVEVTGGYSQANTASEVNSHIAAFENLFSSGDFYYRSYLHSEATSFNTPALDNVAISLVTGETYYVDPSGGTAINPLHSDASHDQWYQYKATLFSEGKDSPILDEVRTEYLNAYITVTAPNGGELYNVGQGINITWNSQAIIGATNQVKIEYSSDGGSNYVLIADNAPNTGTYAWTVSDTPSLNALIKISSVDFPVISDVSNNVFKILALQITSPNGGEIWEIGRTHQITWTTSGAVSNNLTIQYSVNGGTSWTTIATQRANTGTYNWIVPSNASDNLLIKVFDVTNVKITDDSDAVCSIVPSPQVTVSDPIGGEQWKVGTAHTISWRTNHRQFSDQVKLQYSTDGFVSIANDIAVVSIGTPAGPNNNDDILGSYNWTVPDSVSGVINLRVKEDSVPSGRDTQIMIQGTSNTISIIEPSITVNSPTSDAIWTVGDTENITWAAQGTISNNLLIEYSVDSGTTWVDIAAGEANDGAYTWIIPAGAAGDAVSIRITDADRVQVKGESPVFKVLGTATIKVMDPNGAEVLTIGADYELKWQSWGSKIKPGGADYNVFNIYYSVNGAAWVLITDQLANTGSYIWTVPDVETTNAKLKIVDMNDTQTFDESDNTFTIAQPTITITAPNGGETLYATGDYNITWTSHGAVSNALKLEYSSNSGGTWHTIAENEPNDGMYAWVVDDIDSPGTIIRITDTQRPVVTDVSDASFMVKLPVITIAAPNGGEEWVVGTEEQINWTSEGKDQGAVRDNLTIQYTANGTTWIDVVVSKTNDGSFLWTVPDSVSSTCKVKIFDASRPATAGVSAANFSIVLPYVQVLAPNGGESWIIGTQHEITWRGVGTISDNLLLEYSKDNFTNAIQIAAGEANDGTYTWTLPDDYSNNVKVRVTDNDRTDIKDASNSAFSIANPTVLVTAPNGGDLFTVGDIENITWEAVGALSNDLKIEYSKNNFASAGIPIALHAPNTSPYQWTVPDDVSAAVRVRITDNNRPVTFDKSDADFTILPIPVITITAPNGGEVWRVGVNKDITWTDNGGKISNNLALEYSINGGTAWKSIASGTANTGKYTWTIPDDVSTVCLVKITDVTRTTTTDASDDSFRIADPLITIASPNGGEIWAVGDRAPVRWTTEGAVSDSLVLEFSPDNGGTYYFVATVSNSGLYNWTIPDFITSNVLFRIKDANRNATVDLSDASFVINGAPTITVLTPNGIGDEIYVLGDTVNITWEWTGLSISNNIIIDISNDGFITSQNIVRGVPNSGSYQWLLSADTLTGANLKIRITDGNRTTIKDVSDGYFRIRGGFTLTAPNGGEDWGAKSPQVITWQTRGNITRVKLEYTIDEGVNWNSIIASTANAGSYSWTLPDIKSSTVKVRVSDVDDSTVYDLSDSVFHIVYFSVRFTIMDYDTLQHLADISVNEPATGWNETGLNSPLTRTEIYPYGTYTTFFSKSTFIDNSATWSPPKSGTSTYVVTIYLENSASAQVTWDAILTYSFSPANDMLTAVGSLQRKGKLVGTTELERSDMGSATFEIYEPDGETIRNTLVATNPSSINGMYNFTLGGTEFESGKVYPAVLSIEYRGKAYISSANIDVGSEILQYEFFTKTAEKLAVSVQTIEAAVAGGTAQTRTDIEASRQKLVGDLENTRSQLSSDISSTKAALSSDISSTKTDLTSSILTTKTALTDSLSSTETTLKTAVEETRQTMLTAMKSEILNTESAVQAGDTLIIRYRTYSGLKPVIDVYNGSNVQEIIKELMTEIGITGIYEYPVQFKNEWGKGDYSIICSETTKGTLDALTLSVIGTDLEQVYSQISAVLGSTSGLSGLKDVADAMNSQFSMLETALTKIGKQLVADVKDAVNQASALEPIHDQLSKLAGEIKGMTSENGVLDKLLQVSQEGKGDMGYLKNKTQELKAAMELNQKMMDNVANKPVTQTWYEYK